MEKIIRIDDHSGLVLEGGGMRGVFTCGVLDSFMDRGIRFPYTIGVSAGACNGLSYMSGQRGRAKYSNINLLENTINIGLKYLLKKSEISWIRLVVPGVSGTHTSLRLRGILSLSRTLCDGNYQLRDGRSELF